MTGLAKRYLSLVGQYNQCAMRQAALGNVASGKP